MGSLTIEITNSLNEGLDNESIGIGNVEVTVGEAYTQSEAGQSQCDAEPVVLPVEAAPVCEV